MLPPEPAPLPIPPELALEEADPPPSRRRLIPAVAAAEPRGATTPGLEVEEDDDWDCDVPRAIVTKGANQEEIVRVVEI